jgi:hypothetical protein
MMTIEEYRKRAHDCTAAARLASDREGQFQWRVLSEIWLMFAEQLGRGRSSYDKTLFTVPNPVTAIVDADRTSAVEGGERLRARLALVNVSKITA